MREHVRPSVRVHYSIVDGGGAPNVVPATASAAVWIRDDHISDVMKLFERAKTIAAGAAMAANVEAEFRLVSGTYNMMNNKEAAKVAHANLELLGPVPFTDAHDAFARELQQAMGSPVLGDLDGRRFNGCCRRQFHSADDRHKCCNRAGRYTLALLGCGCLERPVDRPHWHDSRR
jgi:aminobenzoyl-glutamate utilization protein B